MHVLNYLLISALEMASPQNSVGVNVDQYAQADLVASVSNTLPAVKTFVPGDVDTAANTVTIAAHGYVTGLKVTLTTDDTLPTPLLTATDYFIIRVSANVIKFATSLANALAGTAVDLTDAGVGTQTITPTALAGCAIKLQKNDEPSTATPIWVDVPSSSQACPSLPGQLTWALADMGMVSLRGVVTLTAGDVTVSLRLNAKGP